MSNQQTTTSTTNTPSAGGNNREEYERAILWVPDPTSPAGWIRRKVWAPEDDTKRRQKPPMGFGFSRPRED